jgi:hypothetical protein
MLGCTNATVFESLVHGFAAGTFRATNKQEHAIL